VASGKPVVVCRHTTTLFDPVEEPLDLVASAIELRAEAVGSLRLLFGDKREDFAATNKLLGERPG
jgi:hypothetical protein